MSLEIIKIQLNELEQFVNNKDFQDLEFIPISSLRVKSFIANPNASPKDFVLYLGYINSQLVAFRSLFAGVVRSGNEQVRFGWCSGNWVHPDHRRNGFSEQLLKEVYSDWDNKLMFTNYAPNSEKLYLKTGWFQPIHQFTGVRAYLFPKTRKLIPASNKNIIYKAIFLTIDFFITLLSSIHIGFYKYQTFSELDFDLTEFPDKQCFQRLKNSDSKHIFNYQEEELKWIFGYPWISSEKSIPSQKYPFSSFSKSFYYKTVKVFSQKEFKGFFIFSVREGHLKTLYFSMPDGFEKEVVAFLNNYSKKNKIELATIYKKELSNELFKRKFPFLYIKQYGQIIYSSFEIKNKNNFEFQDGDGDVIFT